jgi:hypothetical protein
LPNRCNLYGYTEGTRRSDGLTVAIKQVDIFEMSVKKRERCLQEVQLLGNLRHPAIIGMIDSFLVGGVALVTRHLSLALFCVGQKPVDDSQYGPRTHSSGTPREWGVTTDWSKHHLMTCQPVWSL